jgi:hypothetical protein
MNIFECETYEKLHEIWDIGIVFKSVDNDSKRLCLRSKCCEYNEWLKAEGIYSFTDLYKNIWDFAKYK